LERISQVGTLKSQLNEEVELLCKLTTDVTLLCGSSPSDLRHDLATIRRRAHCEGLGFLSKALPKLGKALDRSLETGVLEVPDGFSTKRNSKIPRFLCGLFRHVYSEDGTLSVGDVGPTLLQFECIRGIRQICYLYYKVEVPYDDNSITRVLDEFVDVDSHLPTDFSVGTDQTLLVASQLLEELFADFDPFDVIPGHGPGSVATG